MAELSVQPNLLDLVDAIAPTGAAGWLADFAIANDDGGQTPGTSIDVFAACSDDVPSQGNTHQAPDARLR